MNSPDIFMDKCTRHFRNVLTQAFHHAVLQGTQVVTPIHLMYALLLETGSIGEEILRRSGLKREIIAAILAENPIITLHHDTLLSQDTKRVIEKAVIRAARDGHSYIGTEHILYGLTQIESADVERIFTASSVRRKDLEQQLEVALKSASKLPELLNTIWGGGQIKQRTTTTTKSAAEKNGKQKNTALEYFGIELTTPQYAQKIDPVIGRDEEIERVIHVLARRTKNNPLLLGDPGVGKTAIVEGLAKRMVAGEVPPTLIGKRLFAIDLGLMVAGTMYRGEFESRVKQLVDEVKANPEIILFIDEVHSIVGAGSSSGTLDAANLLKPALARGELRVIGATTFDEFKKNIEHDAALERRFQPVIVREPTADETKIMLTHIKSHYEKFHGIGVSEEAIETAVKLSGKYFPEKKYPDKAIDLLDEAMSAVKVQTSSVDKARKQNELKRELVEMEQKKQKSIIKEDYEQAIRIRENERKTSATLVALQAEQKTEIAHLDVMSKDVTDVVSRILRRIIIEQTTQDAHAQSKTFAEFLSGKIFGQEEAVMNVATTITKSQLGLHGDNRPLASFLFVGSSGVGKTELAKLVAEGLYNDPKALIRMDMTEFSEGYSVSKLLGAPAGYVGYRESTTMVDRLRRQPMSVLLFDEIDKAHPDVMNVLLQMLEEGRLTDSSGKEASVKQAVIILTYQVPLEEISGSQLGFGNDSSVRSTEQIKNSLRALMRPEILNRIDQICVFKPIGEEFLSKIALKLLEEFRTRLARKQITLDWADDDVLACIARHAYEPREGARRVRHIIDEQIEQPLITDYTVNPDHLAYHIRVQNDILFVEPTYGPRSGFTTSFNAGRTSASKPRAAAGIARAGRNRRGAL